MKRRNGRRKRTRTSRLNDEFNLGPTSSALTALSGTGQGIDALNQSQLNLLRQLERDGVVPSIDSLHPEVLKTLSQLLARHADPSAEMLPRRAGQVPAIVPASQRTVARPPNEKELRLEKWKRNLTALAQRHPAKVVGEYRRSGYSVNMAPPKLFANGVICAECKFNGVTKVNVHIQTCHPGPGGLACSCNLSQQSGCVHTLFVIEIVQRAIQERQGPIYAAVSEGAFAPADQERDPVSATLILLDQFLNGLKNETPATVTETAPIAERIVWCVTEEPSISIHPMLQRAKKRGNGWNKPHRLDWHDLLLFLTDSFVEDVDRQVMKHVKLELRSRYSFGYSSDVKISLPETLSILAGCDRVLYEDQPATIEVRPLELRVEADGQLLRFRAAWPFKPKVAEQHSTGLVAIDPTQNRIAVMPHRASHRDLIRALLDPLTQVPIARWPELKPRIDRLCSLVTLELPADLAGEILPLEHDFVAFLRSHDTGALEIGLRVRDVKQQIHVPGQGQLLLTGEHEGRPVQWRREADRENDKAHELSQALRLDTLPPVSDWTWRINDFAFGLQLLEDLEAEGPHLKLQTVWDPTTVRNVSVVGTLHSQNLRVEVSRKKDWFGLSGECQLGEDRISLVDLLNAAQNRAVQGYLEVKPGQWAKVSQDLRQRLNKLRDSLHQNRKSLEFDRTAIPALQELVDGDVDFKATQFWHDSVKRMRSARSLDPIPSKDFQGTLRDYQLQGYKWLRRLAEWGVGGCLADDMGLGKTVQALAVLVDRAHLGPTLIIAPTSVGFNWQREAERFAPTLTPRQYRETSRGEFLKEIGPGDLVICSYGLAMRDAAVLSAVEWGTLVLDEAQNIKNSNSKTAQSIRQFQADWKVALTGTPMENHLGELWSLYHTISPGLFGSWERFRNQFAAPIERDHDDERRIALSHVIKPFLLRRSKKEVLKDLPARTESNLYVDLSAEEWQRYDQMRAAAISELDSVVGLPETGDKRFRILAIMTRLRQLACHIGLVDPTWQAGSAKLDLLVEKLLELREENHRTLVFSQFTQYLGLIRQALDAAGITYEYLDGSTTPKQRQERVDRFQNGAAEVFLISLKAGGTGLNLTAADYVIHMDPWWNPAVEDQATDRAHRIGQQRPVMVYRILTRHTIEEQILSLHQDKRDLVSGVLEGSENSATLSTSQLIDLIRGASREMAST